MLYCTQEKHHYFFCRGMLWNSVFIACICFVISVLCSHVMSCFFLILHFSLLKFSFQLHDYTRSRANSESVNVETPLPFLTVITIGGSFPTCCQNINYNMSTQNFTFRRCFQYLLTKMICTPEPVISHGFLR